MADGPPGGQPRCLRAPRGEQDFLGGEQVDRYLTLLRPADLKALTSADFAARANRACLARGGSERRLGGPKLAEAVLESLEEGPVSIREALALELDAPAALRQALAAYSAGRVRRVSSAGLMGAIGSAGGIATYELPAFVRFCVAYRIHCYLETSLVPQLHPGAVCEKGNLQPEVVFVLGGPGAGKSTQCARIAQVFGHCHLSVAELLREEHSLAGPGSAVELSSLAWEAPAEHLAELLQRAMKDGGWLGKSYVVEGFPRRTADLDVWDRLLGNQIRVTCGLFFAAPESVLAARLRARGASTEAVKRWASESWGEPLGLLERLAARGLLQRVAAEAGVEEVWRGIQGILGPRVVFVLGCPGAGKGTQCARISEAFGYKHLSAGDLLREECRRDPEIEAQVREGKLVSSKTVVALLRRKMEEQGWQGRRYIIDGFPRSLANLEEWNASIKGRASVKLCLHFDCSQAIANARLLDFAKTSGRADDNPEAIGKRFSTWYHGSQPVLQAFKEEGLLRRVDAERSLEAVWGDVQELFGPSVIFALGGPGAGKGTQCTRISETFGYQHLSTGDLLRAERSQSSSPLKALIEEPLSAGRLVPTEVVVRLVQRAMEERGWEGGKYLIDGFPRSFDNWQAWNCIIGQKVSVKHALFFDCSEAIMEARLLSKEDKQSDDTQEAIQQRLEVFRNESVPVVQRFETKGLLRRIDASRTKEEVWSDVKKLFGPSVIFVLGAPNVGKRTLCNRIAETFGYHHVRVEDLEEDWQEGRDGLAGVSAAETKVALLQRAMEANGGKKITMVVVCALALGLAACAVCVLSKGGGSPGQAGEEAVHRERANLRDSTDRNTARSRLVIRTPSPEPRHQGPDDEVQREDLQEHRERDQREKKRHEQELHEEHHFTKKQHNHSEEHNDTRKEHNATKEEYNATEEEHNTTKKEHGHKHKQCKGGPQAACECMLKCEVFGASPSECHSGNERNHSETRAKVDGLISRTMLSHRNMCDGMRCVKDCAKELECLDEKVMQDCSIVKKNYADNKMDSDPDCDLSCDS